MLLKADKIKQMESFSNNFKKAQAGFIVQFKGLSVEQMTDLRFKLRDQNATLQVIRNTLSKRILKQEKAFQDLEKTSLTGPNAFVFAFGDISQTAKVISEFAEDSSILKIKEGLLDQKILTSKDVEQLASLPSMDELKAQLLSLLMTPARQFVSLASEVPSSFVRVINNRVNKEKN